jgi:RNA polymerase sigma factor (sigma-70 family)
MERRSRTCRGPPAPFRTGDRENGLCNTFPPLPPLTHVNGTGAASASRPGDLFLAQLERIDRIIDSICRRNGIRGDDADDVRSWLRTRLIDDDYAVFRRFAGRSSIGTYLTVVLTNLFRDYRIQQWGKWRPSAEAKRLGPLAVQLERLLYRDGCSLREAIQVIRSQGTQLPGDADLARIADRLPRRTPRRPAAALPDDLPSADTADDTVRASHSLRERGEIEAALESVFRELKAEDVVILKLRFWEGLTVADIARTLRLDQRSLYPRMQKLMGSLRTNLERLGVESTHVADLVNEP